MKIKQAVISVLIGLLILSGITTAFASDSNAVTATPTNQKITVDGVPTKFRAYNIEGYNYFMLRDIAYIFKGTKAQFEVGWDQERSAINLETGKAYTGEGVGFNMKTEHTAARGNKCTAAIYKNGQEALLSGYNIEDYTYFKLRDLGSEMGFGVDWDETSQTVVLLSDKYAAKSEPEADNSNLDPFKIKAAQELAGEIKTTTEDQKQQMRENMLILINNARKEEGLNSLVLDDTLIEMAQYKADDMQELNTMGHNGSYGNFNDLLSLFNVEYSCAGENLYFGCISVEEMFNGWMESPGHRSNIMNPQFKKIGISFADDEIIDTGFKDLPKDLEYKAVYDEITSSYRVRGMSYWAVQEFTD